MGAGEGGVEASHVAPRFVAPEGATWIHALHGNVPDHQIDFICCPEAPQGAFTRTHLGHLSRLMKYIEPRTGSPFAFAIGNLSRDDSQHEPGHGALALLFGLRMVGERDSAGRQDPPLAHAIVAVDREVSREAVHAAAMSFHDHVWGREGRCSPGAFYRDYVRTIASRPEDVPRLLERYFRGFEDLPELGVSRLVGEFVEGTGERPGRVFVVLGAGEPFGSAARAAARLSALLYRSSLRWTAIVFGGAVDIPGGISIELVTETPGDVRPGDRVVRLSELPEDDEALARELFGARRVGPRAAAAPETGRRAEAANAAGGAPEDETPTLVRAPELMKEPARRMEIVEVEVDLGGLGEHAGAAAVPPRPPQAVMVARGEARRGGLWLRAGAIGAGMAVAGIAWMAARGGEEPGREELPAMERREASAQPVPSPAPVPREAPVVVEVDREVKAPKAAPAPAPAHAERWTEAAPRTPEAALRAAEPVRTAQEPKPARERRVFRGREVLWLGEAPPAASGGQR